MRLTSATGGECVGALFQEVIGGTNTGTLSVTQTSANLTASLRSSGGLSCNYTGTAAASSMALNATACSAPGLTGFRCANGALRDIRIVSESVSASVSGRTATGAVVTTYDVVIGNTQTSVGTLTTNESLTGTLQ